ncbi:MAG: molybdopterin molybdotransferase MoeA, partial [Bacteroidota bacterium]
MISFNEAFREVMGNTQEWGVETVPLLESIGRVLAEPVLADRDFPPFDRSTRDGIAIHSMALGKGIATFPIDGIQSAGMPPQQLGAMDHCLEIMTGAVVPQNADTVIMYEQTEIKNGLAHVKENPKKGQNIHQKGSDHRKGEVVLTPGRRISPAEIGVLATVGKSRILVKKRPKVAVISTGDELVGVDEVPLPHEIRKSNVISLAA